MAEALRKEKPIQTKIDLTSGSILRKLLIVAIPMLLTSLVQMAYNLTDMFWVAQVGRIGQNPNIAVSAVGIAGFYAWFGFGLILIAKVGISIKVSQAAGRNDARTINDIAVNGLIVMALLAIVYSVYGVFFGKHFFGIFKIANAQVVDQGITYLRIVSGFGMAYYLVNAFNGIYDGLGKTINTFYITASGLVLNMILDPVLILVFGLGVTGAAIATGVSQTVVLIIYLALYISKKRPAQLSLRNVSFKRMKQVFALGLPVGVQSMVMTSISIILGVMVASYGEEIISVSSIGSQIEALSWMVASGFQVALASFVGQNFGAGRLDRVKQGYYTSMAMLIPYGLFINGLLFFAARPLFGLFISSEPTLTQGAIYLRILSFSQLFMILDMVTAGAFNGLGKTYVPSTVQMLGNLIRIPLAILLSALVLGSVAGIWWALTLSSILKGTVLFAGFIFYIKMVSKRFTISIVENSYTV